MIQDIYPHVYDNAYRADKPDASDRVLVYSRNSVYLHGGEKPGIPVYEELRHMLDPMGGEYLYLFSIDNTPYYLFFSDKPFEGRLTLQKMPLSDIRSIQPKLTAFTLITGRQLNSWYHDHRFCGRCGSTTALSETERAIVCPQCGIIVYPKLSPAVIVALTDGDSLLLARYSGRPYANYALIAGFVEIGETLEEAVRREVMEEVGLGVKDIRYYASQPWSFTDSLLMGFFAKLDGSDAITLDKKELAEARFVPRKDIPPADPTISLTGTMIEAFRTGEHLPHKYNKFSAITHTDIP